MFSLLEPVTTIHTVCYADGVLKDVTARRYSMWEMAPDGTIIPAGVPTADAAGPEKAASGP
jgi:hypothetical protein